MSRRARRPDWWPDPERDLEKVIIDQLRLALEGEGHVVTELWYPDRNRQDPRRAGRSTTPDGAMLLDGRQAAVEVAHAWPHPRGDAGHRAARTARLVDEQVRTAMPGSVVFVFGTYDVDALMARPKAGIDREAEAIAAAVVDIANVGPCNQVAIEPDRLPTWLASVHVTRPKSWPDQAGPRRVTLVAAGDRQQHVGDVLLYAMEVKAPRLAEWGLGMVALVEGWGPPTADLAAALAERTDWPLWRFYWLAGGRLRLLWHA